jgi:hypothetical protein
MTDLNISPASLVLVTAGQTKSYAFFTTTPKSGVLVR